MTGDQITLVIAAIMPLAGAALLGWWLTRKNW